MPSARRLIAADGVLRRSWPLRRRRHAREHWPRVRLSRRHRRAPCVAGTVVGRRAPRPGEQRVLAEENKRYHSARLDRLPFSIFHAGLFEVYCRF